MPRRKPFRHKICRAYPTPGMGKRPRPIREEFVYVDGDRITEEVVHTPFACGCSVEHEELRFTCSSCGQAVCQNCPEAGHTRGGIPLCGQCSRSVERGCDIERMTPRQFCSWRLRKRARAVLSLLGSVVLTQGDDKP